MRPRRWTPRPGRWRSPFPRDQAGMFEPMLAEKRQRRLGDIDEMVL
ncbi:MULTISPECIES: hypothetical protein [unclassified Streptomyces]|nr:hypothetical protein [Streptomyces sp. SM10]